MRAMTRTLSEQRFAPTSKRSCPISALEKLFFLLVYDFIMPIFKYFVFAFLVRCIEMCLPFISV